MKSRATASTPLALYSQPDLKWHLKAQCKNDRSQLDIMSLSTWQQNVMYTLQMRLSCGSRAMLAPLHRWRKRRLTEVKYLLWRSWWISEESGEGSGHKPTTAWLWSYRSFLMILTDLGWGSPVGYDIFLLVCLHPVLLQNNLLQYSKPHKMRQQRKTYSARRCKWKTNGSLGKQSHGKLQHIIEEYYKAPHERTLVTRDQLEVWL